MPEKPSSSIAQVEGSGTAATGGSSGKVATGGGDSRDHTVPSRGFGAYLKKTVDGIIGKSLFECLTTH